MHKVTYLFQAYFEDLSVKEQIALVHCADLLIGIHGAGLEHYRFMRPHSALIQVGWQHWEATHLYDIPAKIKLIRARKLQNCNATISDEAWANYFKLNPEFSGKSRQEIYNISTSIAHFSLRENIWKYADCTLNVADVVSIAKAMELTSSSYS